jgi:hypothetical protein
VIALDVAAAPEVLAEAALAALETRR